MTDHELLELAGLAAGETYSQERNPLERDDLALRLAVNLDIVPRVINGVAFAWRDGVCDIQEPHNGDPYAATRRAVVRAAAEIWRAKE